METDQLLQCLTENAKPVARLRSPWVRALVWLALTAPYVALIVLVMTLRSDWASKLSEPRFLIEEVAALATGITAAIAAFASTIPGYDRRLLTLPLLPLALWLSSLGQGCVEAWVEFGPDGLALRPDWLCFPATVLVGIVPAIVIVMMLRFGAPLTPHLTAALASLAAAGLANFGLRLFHPVDASLMVLVWQFGSVVALSCLAALAGRSLFSWRSIVPKWT